MREKKQDKRCQQIFEDGKQVEELSELRNLNTMCLLGVLMRTEPIQAVESLARHRATGVGLGTG